MKERNQMILDRFLGVDFTTSPLKVDPRRSVSGKNFLSDYATMKKRPGWIEKYKFADRKITGMYYYRGLEEFWLVRAGDKIYKVDPSFTTQTTLYTTEVVQNEAVTFIYQEDKVYIIGCGKYLVLTVSIVDNEPSYSITEVKNDAFIPTTTISIDDTAATNPARASLEHINLLTIKRKNTLIGRDVANLEWILDSSIRNVDNILAKTYVDIEYIDGSELKMKKYETFPDVSGLERYLFDANESEKILANAKGEIELQVVGVEAKYYWKISREAEFNIANTKWYVVDTIAGIPTASDVENLIHASKELWDSSQGDGIVRLENIGYGYSYWRLMYEEAVAPFGGYKKIKIYEATPPPIEGIDNITVTFESADVIDGSGIFTAENAIVFGVNGTTNQMFVSKGNEEHYSKAYDFTYFPDTYTNYLGAKGNSILGYERLSDSSMVIYKGNSAGESRLYFRTMELVTDNEELFYEYRLIDRAVDENIGCDASGSIANLNGDHLFLSNLGVYAVTLGDNVSVEMRHARERGTPIKKKIESYSKSQLATAKAIVHDSRYYLCIGQDVYVADARYRTAANMDDTFNYEWYYWDNIDATSWITIDDILYFGTSEGRICQFDDEFSDRTLIRASEGDVTLTLSDNYLIYNQEITVNNEDLIKASIYQKHLDHLNMSIETNIITASNAETLFYEGMEVYIDNVVGDSGLVEGQKYYISNINLDTFQLYDGENFVTPIQVFDILEDLTDVQLYVTQHDDVNNKFRLKRNENGLPINVVNYTGNPITFVITLIDAVEMVWYTPIFDLGSNMWAKTLLGITISADASTTGAIEFGFDTRNISSNIQSLNYQSFTFDDIDFNNFTFLTAIASSYTLRVKEKDFNFIILKFGSKTPTSAVINNVTIYYKVNTMNRGIR